LTNVRIAEKWTKNASLGSIKTRELPQMDAVIKEERFLALFSLWN
jgi:hypothetical protein